MCSMYRGGRQNDEQYRLRCGEACSCCLMRLEAEYGCWVEGECRLENVEC